MQNYDFDQLNLKVVISQIEFARRMNARQWTTLKALSEFRFPLSANEWSDPDMIALFENGLVCCRPSEDGISTSWAASDAGANLVILRAENSLLW